jgi:hypothetical protein
MSRELRPAAGVSGAASLRRELGAPQAGRSARWGRRCSSSTLGPGTSFRCPRRPRPDARPPPGSPSRTAPAGMAAAVADRAVRWSCVALGPCCRGWGAAASIRCAATADTGGHQPAVVHDHRVYPPTSQSIARASSRTRATTPSSTQHPAVENPTMRCMDLAWFRCSWQYQSTLPLSATLHPPDAGPAAGGTTTAFTPGLPHVAHARSPLGDDTVSPPRASQVAVTYESHPAHPPGVGSLGRHDRPQSRGVCRGGSPGKHSCCAMVARRRATAVG